MEVVLVVYWWLVVYRSGVYVARVLREGFSSGRRCGRERRDPARHLLPISNQRHTAYTAYCILVCTHCILLYDILNITTKYTLHTPFNNAQWTLQWTLQRMIQKYWQHLGLLCGFFFFGVISSTVLTKKRKHTRPSFLLNSPLTFSP